MRERYVPLRGSDSNTINEGKSWYSYSSVRKLPLVTSHPTYEQLAPCHEIRATTRARCIDPAPALATPESAAGTPTSAVEDLFFHNEKSRQDLSETRRKNVTAVCSTSSSVPGTLFTSSTQLKAAALWAANTLPPGEMMEAREDEGLRDSSPFLCSSVPCVLAHPIPPPGRSREERWACNSGSAAAAAAASIIGSFTRL